MCVYVCVWMSFGACVCGWMGELGCVGRGVSG